jgi:peroxiredoxin family protein
MPAEAFGPGAVLGILLLSGTHERAHYAFVLAAAAAAMGRRVVIFATNEGCRALCRDWSSLDGSGRDAGLRARGIAGIGELREAATELGTRLIACELGMKIAAIDPSSLEAGVEVAGVATFLEAVPSGGQTMTL